MTKGEIRVANRSNWMNSDSESRRTAIGVFGRQHGLRLITDIL